MKEYPPYKQMMDEVRQYECTSASAASDTAEPIRLRVVIVSHGRCDLLERTLRSLEAAVIPPGYQGTLIVENGERYGAEDVSRRFEETLRTKYIFIEDPRKTVALNAALNACGDVLVIFLDDDVRVSPGTLKAYAEAAASCGRGWYFGGPTGVDYDEPPPQWLLKFLPASARGLSFPGNCAAIQFPEYFLGFNWAAFANDLKSCGGFPTHFGPGTPSGGGDETFLQLRLNSKGIYGRVVRPAMVWHYVPHERCSPQWTLERAVHNSFNQGVYTEHHGRSQQRSMRLFRDVGLAFRRCLRARTVLKILLLRPGAIFEGRYRLISLIAFLRGYRYALKHCPLGQVGENAGWVPGCFADRAST